MKTSTLFYILLFFAVFTTGYYLVLQSMDYGVLDVFDFGRDGDCSINGVSCDNPSLKYNGEPIIFQSSNSDNTDILKPLEVMGEDG